MSKLENSILILDAAIRQSKGAGYIAPLNASVAREILRQLEEAVELTTQNERLSNLMFDNRPTEADLKWAQESARRLGCEAVTTMVLPIEADE